MRHRIFLNFVIRRLLRSDFFPQTILVTLSVGIIIFRRKKKAWLVAEKLRFLVPFQKYRIYYTRVATCSTTVRILV